MYKHLALCNTSLDAMIPAAPNGAFPRGAARGITEEEEEGNCFLEELELNVSLLTSNSALMG